MGCCKSRAALAAERRAHEQDAAMLGELVGAAEAAAIAQQSRRPQDEVAKLEALLACRPARIAALTLAGECLVEAELSVSRRVADLEKAVWSSGAVDAKEFVITLVYAEEILSSAQRLCDAGMRPDQDVQVTVLKKERPKRNPALDRALFFEAWRGGGNAAAVQDLLEKCADPNGYTYSDGDKALHVSAGRGYAAVVRVLLDAKADVDVPGVAMMTPLERCTQRGTDYWKGRYPEVEAMIRERLRE
eukprot:TRINITY_DN40505_c0_g1_i1.p2 TRINITY_DN40505_c0_g1~~TRINITY_DN40505_c0_g1_i1.p2  ORF type:complete len:255 (-),score=56.38 TRINITY_DN40505_c0_g1_i1:41-778(-)